MDFLCRSKDHSACHDQTQSHLWEEAQQGKPAENVDAQQEDELEEVGEAVGSRVDIRDEAAHQAE